LFDLKEMYQPKSEPVTFVRNDTFTKLGPELREKYKSHGGSREHFFHFLLGYLLPLVHEQELNQFDRIRVLDCGPLMTPILTETIRKLGYKFEVVPNRGLKNPAVVAPWDYHWENTREVRAVVEKVADVLLQDMECQELDCPTSSRVLLKRSKPHPYYTPGGKAEIPTYGAGRRAISELPEISAALTNMGVEHNLYEPGRHSIGCQISTFRNATHVSGIRGAEWANLVWATPNLKAMIFDPAPPAETLQNLMLRLGIQGTFISVQQKHFELEVELILKFYS